MKPATAPRARHAERLLLLDADRPELRDLGIADLPSLLKPGDLLVVNDAATLPASLALTSHAGELRLLGQGPRDDEYRALAFGAGDFRTPTEERPEPPRFALGERLVFDRESGLAAHVIGIDASSPRLLEIRFTRSGAALWRALYRAGRPIQYAYSARPLELWDVQTRYAGRPWALEAPSAGLPLSFELLQNLRRRGVGLGALTHAAGISSTGSAELDRLLPLPERYAIGEATALRVAEAHARGGRVVAVGTSVVRALESSALRSGAPEPGEGVARLRIGPGFRLRVVDGLLTGLHEPGSSHFDLLHAFADRALLERAVLHARSQDYLAHEFGDACLILRSARAMGRSAA